MITGPTFLHEVIGHFYEKRGGGATTGGGAGTGGGAADEKAQWTLKPKMAFLQTPQDL
jgi:hypothetical protein